MKTSTLGSPFFIPKHSNLVNPEAKKPSFLVYRSAASHSSHPSKSLSLSTGTRARNCSRVRAVHPAKTNRINKAQISPDSNQEVLPLISLDGHSRLVILGAVSLGLAMLFAGMDDQKALALGPDGPLVEEFWDNVRRYGLYILTVSTGVIYTVFQPIFELLKNPITAVLIIVILVGSVYIVSQVVSAMVGVSEFAYEYAY